MELLTIFTSEEEGTEEMLEILSKNGVSRGVVIESQGMRKVLTPGFVAEKIFGFCGDKRAFNRTILAIVEKENVRKIISLIRHYWDSGRDRKETKNRVMFSTAINNLTIGI